jgi:hypothetical protein
MEHGVDDDSLRFDFVEDHIRESADQGLAEIIENGRIHERVSLDGQNRRFETTQEFQTQAKTLLLVPDICIGGILSGPGGEMRLSTPWIQGSTS